MHQHFILSKYKLIENNSLISVKKTDFELSLEFIIHRLQLITWRSWFYLIAISLIFSNNFFDEFVMENKHNLQFNLFSLYVDYSKVFI